MTLKEREVKKTSTNKSFNNKDAKRGESIMKGKANSIGTINVSDIEENPFRRMGKFRVNPVSVEMWKEQIEQDLFGIEVRPNPATDGKYQLVYGYHPLLALREMKIEEIELSRADYDDMTMLACMADGNFIDDPNPATAAETTRIVKETLDRELAKHKRRGTLPGVMGHFRRAFRSDSHFQRCKREGVGPPEILSFLNSDCWEEWMIEEGFALLTDAVNRKAIEALPSIYHAREFREAVMRFGCPWKDQLSIAITMREEGIGARDVSSRIKGIAAARNAAA